MKRVTLLLCLLSVQTYADTVDKGTTFEIGLTPSDPDRGVSKIIADKSQPKITLSKWNGLSQMGIQYTGLSSTGTKDPQADKIGWTDGSQTLQAYLVPADTQNEDGSVEIEIVLQSEPVTNVFSFVVTGAATMDWLYQAPLDQEDNSGDTRVFSCTPNDCFRKDGSTVAHRPDNVVGSYAVYSKVNKDHVAGGVNFANGKLFHLYRPQAKDAKGTTVWGSLNYANGQLDMMFPQDYLDNAVYPVTIDPTYGYTSLGATEDDTADCFVGYLGGAYPGVTGGKLSGGHWYGRQGTGTSSSIVSLGLYPSLTAGAALIDGMSATLSLTTAKTQFSIPGTGASALTNGTNYGLGAISNLGAGGGDWKNEYDTGGTGIFQCPITGTTAPSTVPTSGGAFNKQTSFYFDYTDPSGTTTSGNVQNQIQGGMVTINGGQVTIQ